MSDEPKSFLHFTMVYTPKYIEENEENVQQSEDELVEYMPEYDEDDFDLVKPTIKYNAEGML